MLKIDTDQMKVYCKGDIQKIQTELHCLIGMLYAWICCKYGETKAETFVRILTRFVTDPSSPMRCYPRDGLLNRRH